MGRTLTENGADGRQALPGLNGALLVVLLGTWLRFHWIDAQSLWYDEGNTAHMTLRTPGEIVAAAAADIHPPGYYLALTGWSRMAGRSEFALRGFSAFTGIVLLGVLYRLARDAWGATGGSVALFFGAVHPALVYYSQEARMYMLASMLGAVAVFVAGRLLAAKRGERERVLAFTYVGVGAFGLYSHYTFAYVLIAINVAALWQFFRGRSRVLRIKVSNWALLQFGVVALYSAWMPTAIRHLTTWPAPRVRLPWLTAGAEMWRWLSFGPTISTADAMPGTLALASLVVAGAVFGGGGAGTLMWLLVPAGLTLSLGLFTEPFAKFMLLAVPAVPLLASGGVVALLLRSRRNLAHVCAIVAVGISLWSSWRAMLNLYGNSEYRRDDYRAIVADIKAELEPGDAILLDAPNQTEAFSYYYRDFAPVFPVARARPLDAEVQRAELTKIAAKHNRFFVLFWGEGQADPERVVERWLNEHSFKTTEKWYGQVRVASYSLADGSVASMGAGDALFGEVIELVGYGVDRESYWPGDVVQVTLSWRPRDEVGGNYKIFVHVYSDSDTPPVAQHDGGPGGGIAPTADWKPGIQVVDRHGVQLPSTIPAGEYILAVGMYSAVDGTRLHVSGEAAHDNRLELGTIAVRQ
ncbi:MAG TPA: glycosyltransferase family 39 protein [Anaerolineales bacterium]|jgi:hypothetical protein|nr:glycosyltransferase family 39 protein [Anaerolineales bacterium]